MAHWDDPNAVSPSPAELRRLAAEDPEGLRARFPDVPPEVLEALRLPGGSEAGKGPEPPVDTAPADDRQRLLLDHILGNSPVGLAIVRGSDHRFDYVNPAYQAILGPGAPPLVGRPFAEVFPGVAGAVLPSLEEAYRTGRAFSWREYPASLGPGREETWWNVDQVPLPGPDGNPEAILLLTNEVTDLVLARREAERCDAEAKVGRSRLRESEELSARILASSQDCIKVLDLDGRLLSMSGGGQRLMEIDDVTSYLGTSWIDFWPEQDRPRVREAVAAAAAGGVERFEASCPTVKGSPRWWDVVLSPIHDAEGRPERLLAISRDETRRQEAEQALWESEKRLRALVDASSEVLYRVSPHWTEMLQLHGGGLLADTTTPSGSWLASYIPPDEQPRVLAAIQEAIRKKTVFELEHRVWREDGSEGWVLSRAVPILHPSGEITEWFGAASDATTRKEAEQALRRAKEAAEEANRAKSEFLARMSHEIRTPMNGIMGMIELALMEGVPAKPAQCLGLARQSARDLLDIINDILDLSKIEAGRVELDVAPFVLRRVLAAVGSTLEVAAHQKGVRLSLHVDPAVPDALVGDEGRLRQVLTNLVGNAVKFTEHGQVEIEVSPARPSGSEAAGLADPVHLLFTVQDSGVGIPPENLNAVFESFSPATRSTHAQYGGTGLGLSISKHLVELMGGEIWAESTPGQGSRFSFRVAFGLAATPSATAEPRTPAPAPAPVGRALRILVAEDNPVNEQVVRSLLEAQGHRAEGVSTGKEALEALARGAYDGVLMDVDMPDMDGLEATRRIRRGEVAGISPDVPIVALTAHAFAGDRERFLAAGMDGYLSKPFEPDDLAGVVASWRSRTAVLEPEGPETGPESGVPEVEQRLYNRLARLPRERVWALVDLFREKVPEQLAALREALDADDASQLATAAHTLRGSAIYFGTAQMVERCTQLEERGRDARLEGADVLLGDLAKEIRRVERFFAQARERERG